MSLSIQFVSDLHLEMPQNTLYLKESPIVAKADTLIIAGDLTYLSDSQLENSVLDRISNDFERVYVVPGNHEYYGKHFPIENAFPSLDLSVRDNMSYLNNLTIIEEGVRILFTTLFSSIDPKQANDIRSYIRDFSGTRFGEDSMSSLTLRQFDNCHLESITFLEQELHKPFDGKTVVVSHYSPFGKGWIKNYPNFSLDLSSFFHTNLEWLCDQYHIDHWISGHTHIPFAPFQISGTWMHCNMLGYVHLQEHHNFDHSAVLRL
jgi:predicted phosphodiesterase